MCDLVWSFTERLNFFEEDIIISALLGANGIRTLTQPRETRSGHYRNHILPRALQSLYQPRADATGVEKHKPAPRLLLQIRRFTQSGGKHFFPYWEVEPIGNIRLFFERCGPCFDC